MIIHQAIMCSALMLYGPLISTLVYGIGPIGITTYE